MHFFDLILHAFAFHPTSSATNPFPMLLLHFGYDLLNYQDLNPIQELDTTTEDTPEKKTEGGVSEDNDDA